MKLELTTTGVKAFWREAGGGAFDQIGAISMAPPANDLSHARLFGRTNQPGGHIDTFVIESDIPEPASLALLSLGGLMVLRRRR